VISHEPTEWSADRPKYRPRRCRCSVRAAWSGCACDTVGPVAERTDGALLSLFRHGRPNPSRPLPAGKVIRTRTTLPLGSGEARSLAPAPHSRRVLMVGLYGPCDVTGFARPTSPERCLPTLDMSAGRIVVRRQPAVTSFTSTNSPMHSFAAWLQHRRDRRSKSTKPVPAGQPANGHSCVLVLLGVRLDGTKELLALAEGLRESTESWADLLRDCRRRGMRDPELVVDDGAIGAMEGSGRSVSPPPVIKGAGSTKPEILRTPFRSARSRARRRPCRKSTTPRTARTPRRPSRRSRKPTARSGPRLPRRSPTTGRAARLLRLPGRALGTLADHQSHRVHILHGQAADQGHPRGRQPGRRPRHGIQVGRVSPGTLA
jgi:hypothetical protein